MPAALFGILVSALNSVFSFLLKSFVIKFVVYIALFFIVSEFTSYLVSMRIFPSDGDANTLNNVLVYLPSGVWYFLDLFNIGFGLRWILTAWLTRFMIRRLPVIG